MKLSEFLKPLEIDTAEWLRNAMRGILAPDPLGDMALDIVEELEIEINSRETPWRSGELQDVVEGIIREHLSKLDEATETETQNETTK